jgi:hypothetical protein
MNVQELLSELRTRLFAPRRSRQRDRRPGPGLLDLARCPRCGEPLIARMTRRGPCFPCACSARKAAKSAYQRH